METIEQNIQQVQTVINNVEQEIIQVDSIASQAQDAVNPEQQNKRRAAEAKVKAGSSLLQKLGELFGTIANTIAPVARMEGEPLPDPKYYGQKVIDSIKKAATVKDVQTIYNNAERNSTLQHTNGTVIERSLQAKMMHLCVKAIIVRTNAQ